MNNLFPHKAMASKNIKDYKNGISLITSVILEVKN